MRLRKRRFVSTRVIWSGQLTCYDLGRLPIVPDQTMTLTTLVRHTLYCSKHIVGPYSTCKAHQSIEEMRHSVAQELNDLHCRIDRDSVPRSHDRSHFVVLDRRPAGGSMMLTVTIKLPCPVQALQLAAREATKNCPQTFHLAYPHLVDILWVKSQRVRSNKV